MERSRPLRRCRHYSRYARISSLGRRGGKVTGQYLLNQLHRALQLIERKAFTQAARCLNEALRYPDNLGEGGCPGRRTTISGICWAIARNRLGMRTGQRNITSLPCKGAQRWTPGVTTTISPPITFSGRASRCVRAVIRRRPSSTSRILSPGPGSIGMTFRKPTFCRLSPGSGGARCFSAAAASAALLVY